MEGETEKKLELRALHLGPEVSEVLVAVKMPTARIMELLGPEVYARMDYLEAAKPKVRETSTRKSPPVVKPAVKNYEEIPEGRPRCAVKGCKKAKVHGQGQKYCPAHKASKVRIRDTQEMKDALSAGGGPDEDA